MTNITDLAGPIVERVTDALIDAGIGAFMPVVFEGEDMIALMLADLGEVQFLETTVRKVLAGAGVRGVEFGASPGAEGAELATYLVTFPISTNTITRLDTGDCR